ncbi:V-type ATP synthase subunit F [bacterium]|nr:V-type ATP synthase subunit F [bacterium]
MKFYVIGDEETVLGFRLVGVEGRVVHTPEEIHESLEYAFKMEELGVIIITERVASTIRSMVDQYIYKTTFPLIIEIPDREGKMEGRGTVRDLIRAAVGVHL